MPAAVRGLDEAAAYLTSCVTGGLLPSAVLEVGRADQVLGRIACATRDDAVYDLASLTKVLATGLLAARLLAQRRLDLDTPVADLVPDWQRRDRIDVRIRDLLAHASGLPPHLPLYEQHHGADAVVAASANADLVTDPRRTAIYSDLGFVVLGRALERADGQPLDAQMGALRRACTQAPLGFAPVPAGHDVQPTGHSAWRGRDLVGEVHDDNAAAMGGVAGHAGLFGSAGGVGDVARHVLQGLRGQDTRLAPAWALRAFSRRSPVPGSSRALAWDTSLPTSSCGGYVSDRAIGHTGHTGTSVWIDPAYDRYVVLLTNRVAGRAGANDMLRIRRRVHALIGAARPGAWHA